MAPPPNQPAGPSYAPLDVHCPRVLRRQHFLVRKSNHGNCYPPPGPPPSQYPGGPAPVYPYYSQQAPRMPLETEQTNVDHNSGPAASVTYGSMAAYGIEPLGANYDGGHQYDSQDAGCYDTNPWRGASASQSCALRYSGGCVDTRYYGREGADCQGYHPVYSGAGFPHGDSRYDQDSADPQNCYSHMGNNEAGDGFRSYDRIPSSWLEHGPHQQALWEPHAHGGRSGQHQAAAFGGSGGAAPARHGLTASSGGPSVDDSTVMESPWNGQHTSSEGVPRGAGGESPREEWTRRDDERERDDHRRQRGHRERYRDRSHRRGSRGQRSPRHHNDHGERGVGEGRRRDDTPELGRERRESRRRHRDQSVRRDGHRDHDGRQHRDRTRDRHRDRRTDQDERRDWRTDQDERRDRQADRDERRDRRTDQDERRDRRTDREYCQDRRTDRDRHRERRRDRDERQERDRSDNRERGEARENHRGHHERQDRQGGFDDQHGSREKHHDQPLLHSREHEERHRREGGSAPQGDADGHRRARSPDGDQDRRSHPPDDRFESGLVRKHEAEHRRSSRRPRGRSESRYHRDDRSHEARRETEEAVDQTAQRREALLRLLELPGISVKRITYDVEDTDGHEYSLQLDQDRPAVIPSTSTSASSYRPCSTPALPAAAWANSRDRQSVGASWTPPGSQWPPVAPSTTMALQPRRTDLVPLRERLWGQYSAGAQAEIAAIEAGHYGSICSRPEPVLEYPQYSSHSLHREGEEALTPRSRAARGIVVAFQKDYYKLKDSMSSGMHRRAEASQCGQPVVADPTYYVEEVTDSAVEENWRLCGGWSEDECYGAAHIDQAALEGRLMAFEAELDNDEYSGQCAGAAGVQQVARVATSHDCAKPTGRAASMIGESGESMAIAAAQEDDSSGRREAAGTAQAVATAMAEVPDGVPVRSESEGRSGANDEGVDSALYEGVDESENHSVVASELEERGGRKGSFLSDGYVTVSSFVDAEEVLTENNASRCGVNTAEGLAERLTRLFVDSDQAAWEDSPPLERRKNNKKGGKKNNRRRHKR